MADERRGGVARALRALWPRSRVGRALLVGVPLLFLLLVIAPFVSAASGLVDLLGRLVSPLVETATGRLLLLNLLLLLGAAIVIVVTRDRLRDLRAGLRLRAHLDGVGAFVGGEPRRARELLQRAARSRARAPGDLPELGAHARLLLARIALDDGQPDDAMRWLAEVREADLPGELRQSLAQLGVRALDLQGEVLPEQLERDVRAALAKFPRDRVLLGRLRELLRTRGALEEAADVQQRIVDEAPAADAAGARARLCRDLVEAGQSALRESPDAALVFADRASRADPAAAGPHLLRGDALRARGDLAEAVRAYAAVRDARALGRVASLLDAHPDALSPRDLLEAFPLDGGILLAAREFARRGDSRAAWRAARLALRHLEPVPEVALAVADVLRIAGREADADRLLRDASERLVAPDADAR